VLSLAMVAACFVIGITASLIADNRDPQAAEEQDHRAPDLAEPESESEEASTRG
jgi:hypothetical protein